MFLGHGALNPLYDFHRESGDGEPLSLLNSRSWAGFRLIPLWSTTFKTWVESRVAQLIVTDLLRSQYPRLCIHANFPAFEVRDLDPP